MQKPVKRIGKRKGMKNHRPSAKQLHEELELKREGGCATWWRKLNSQTMLVPDKATGKEKRVAVPVEAGSAIVTQLIPAGAKSMKMLMQDTVHGPTWLDRYYTGSAKRKPLLNADEYDAGMELLRAWKFLLYGIKWSYDRPSSDGGGGNGDATDAVAGLQYSERILQDFRNANLSIEQRMVIQNVCCMDYAAGDKDRAATLKRGLAIMAIYWARIRPVCGAHREEEMAQRRAAYQAGKISA